MVSDGGKKDEGVDAIESGGANRRSYERYDTSLHVDIRSGETFLFAYITNISEMGIFIHSESPLSIGTELTLRFATEDGTPFELPGMVVWINPLRMNGDNPNPGMGVRFSELTLDQRERVVALVRTVAYLQDDISVLD